MRTYLVEPHPVLSHEDIADAEVQIDPYSNQPIVMVTFTRDGGRRFGDLTAANIGHKLAIVTGGEINSAPIIQGAIRGGRCTITMGGADPEQMGRDAAGLAAALRDRVPLPAGLTARLVGHEGAEPAIGWLVRVLFGLLAGALAWFAVPVLERRHWFLRTPEVTGASRRRTGAVALAAVITVGIPALLWYVARTVALPGVNDVELSNIVARGGSPFDGSLVGVLALGVTPVITAAGLVELAALVLPALRARRLGTPTDRVGLDRAVVLLTIALALLEGWIMATYLGAFSRHGAEILIDNRRPALLLIALTLAAGVMVQMIAARFIDRRGLCNGWLALIAGSLVAGLIEQLAATPTGHRDPRAGLLAIAAVAGVAAVAATALRSTDDQRRLPWAGLVPAMVVPSVIALQQIGGLMWPEAALWLDRVRPGWPWFDLLIAVPFTGIAAWAGRRDVRWPGVAVSVTFVILLVLLPLLLPTASRSAGAGAALTGMILGLAAVELIAGARARDRLADPVAVLVVHDVDRADRAGDALRTAGVAHALIGVRWRALLRFFGSYAPVSVLVARQDTDAARSILSQQ